MTDDTTHAVNSGELRQIVERFERLGVDKQDMQKEVMAEAKARGYEPSILRKVIAMRKKTPDDLAEEQALIDMYAEAVGVK